MKKLLLLTAAGLIAVSAPVLADNHGDHSGKGGKGDRGAKMFEKQDTNSDGVISEAEFMAKAKEKFSKMDANGDGTVTKEEAKAAHEKKREERKGKKKERKAE